MTIALRPSLSLRERDRRWASIRNILRERALDCLLVGGFAQTRQPYDNYITNDHLDGMVIFPLSGEPVVLVWNSTLISRALESRSRGVDLWVTDYRVGLGSAPTAAILEEKGFYRGRIGVVGLGATAVGAREGCVPNTWWANLTSELRSAAFEDITQPFADLLLVKSEEEIALIRYAAQVSEAACRVMLDVTRPGVGEETIYAEIMREIFRHGCDARYPFMSLQSGPQNIGWGRPRWIISGEEPRRIQRGDMVQAEIHTYYAYQEAQVQMSIAVDPVDEVNQRCEAVARQVYEAGLKKLRPGIAFAELIHAMEEPLRESGCWAKTPLAHAIDFGPGGSTVLSREQLHGTEEGRIEGHGSPGLRRGDLVLRPGMLLELEPNACIGKHRVNIGTAVIVTEKGCEQLNALPTRVRHVP